MSLLTSALEAQFHREAYVVILNSLLRAPGGKRALAQRTKISSVYLSYILKLNCDPYHTLITRTPSPKVAQRIAQAACAPAELRESLLRRMTLANAKRIQAISLIGPLHRVLFMRTFARLCRMTQDVAGWKYFIEQAYRLAGNSGLQHQINRIEDESKQGQSTTTE